MADTDNVRAHLEELKKKVEEIKQKSKLKEFKYKKSMYETQKLIMLSDVAIKQKKLLIAKKDKEIKTYEIMLNNWRLKRLRSTLRQRQRIRK